MKRLMFFVLVFAAAAGAQQPAQPAPAGPSSPDAPVVGRPPLIEASHMVLDFVSAPASAPAGMLGSVMHMYRRDIYVKNADGSVTGPVRNQDENGSGFIVYDTADYVATVKAAVAKALATLPPEEPRPAPQIATYTPRNVDVNRLAEALEPLRRKVIVPGQPGSAPDVRQNLSFQASPAMLSLQDTPEQLERMLALLREVDQPAPQFLIQGMVLAESANEGDDSALPAELSDNLHRLLPYRGFTQLALVLLRASVQAGEEQSLSGQLTDGKGFQITLLPGGVDLANGRISMQRLRFECGNQAFETSAVIQLGEYTVIGGVGSNPSLLVLRVSSLSGK
jgi:hypothetical protein